MNKQEKELSQVEQLEARIKDLEAILKGIGFQTRAPATTPQERADYVAFGSTQHALFLGLKVATDEDSLQLEGWTLADMTAYGPAARKEFLFEILRQKVTEWKSGAPQVPANAPAMWVPGAADSLSGV